MWRPIVVLLAVGACTRSDPQQTRRGDSQSGNAGEHKMGSVALRIVTTQSGQPADAVGWGPDGIVTADSRGVVSWHGADAPGTQIPLDSRIFGFPRSITFLADGTVGVGAARFDRSGKNLVDVAALEQAFVAGLPGIAAWQYRTRTAAWTPDGQELWIALEHKPRKGSRDKPSTSSFAGPRSRNLVLGADLALKRQIDEAVAWTAVVAQGDQVATIGPHLELYARTTGSSRRLSYGPPVRVAIASDGSLVAAAEIGRVMVTNTADGTQVTFDVPAAISLGAVAIARGVFATGDSGGNVRLFRIEGGNATEVAQVTVEGMVTAIAFSPDARGLVVGSAPQQVTVLAIDGL